MRRWGIQSKGVNETLNMTDRPLNALGFGSLREKSTTLFAGFWGGVHETHVGELTRPPAKLTRPSRRQSLLLLLLGREKNTAHPEQEELSLTEKFRGCWLHILGTGITP